MTKRWLGLAAAMVGLLGGCTLEATIDTGIYDFNLAGAWTIDGQPATSESCAAAGVDRVRLVATSTVPANLPIPTLDFACSAGSFATVTYPFYYGTYNFQWQGYSGATQVVTADLDPLVVASPTAMATLATLDIVTAPAGDFSLAGSWTIGGEAADASNCAALGIDTIAVVTTDGTSSAAEVELVYFCEDGSFHETESLLPYGSYILRWEARSATGTVIASQVNPVLTVNDPLTMATIAPFDIAIPSSFLINLTYDGALCEMSSVAKIRFRFWRQTAEGVYDPAAETILNELGGDGIDCTNSLFFGPPEFTLAPGFYSFYVEGFDASDNKLMTATENDLALDAGEMVFYNAALVNDF